jgi:cytochrome c
MQSLEFNKAFAALLTAGLTFGLAGQLGKFLVHGEKPHETAIAIADAAPVAAAPAAAALEPVSGLIANANVESGKTRFAQQCGICHSPNEGGKNGVGPNLWSVLGSTHGHAAGFNYSDALKGKQGPWTYEGLNAWLAKPAAYAPGTRMAYAGLPSVQQRAEIIAYIRTLSATPIALPAAAAAVVAPAAAAATPAAAAPAAAAANGPTAPIFADLPDIKGLLASADPENGKAKFTQQCGICHTPNEGGRNGVGPNLWNVVGRNHAATEGFNYSAANKALADHPWTYAELNKWIYKPTVYMPGTRMVFAGVADNKTRADIIAYLRTLSNSPQPLP